LRRQKLLSRSISAGIIKLGRDSVASKVVRYAMRISARVSSGLNLLMATERAATTPAKLKGRFKPQQFAPVSCTGDCLSHHSEESRLPQTLFRLFHTDGAAHPLQGEDLVQRK
jgi:hypothetical protein